jgi:hypothetical protein
MSGVSHDDSHVPAFLDIPTLEEYNDVYEGTYYHTIGIDDIILTISTYFAVFSET